MRMKNRDIYLKDPSVQKLVNEGVANAVVPAIFWWQPF